MSSASAEAVGAEGTASGTDSDVKSPYDDPTGQNQRAAGTLRLLLVSPGAPFSTSDVYDGMSAALKRVGHEVHEYGLTDRVQEAIVYQRWRERTRRRLHKTDPRPETEEPIQVMERAIHQASMTLLEATLTVNPHAVLIFSGQFLHPNTMRLLYRMGAPTVLMLTESPYDDGKQSALTPYARAVTTNERASVRLLERWYEQTRDGNPYAVRGARKVHYLPHAYDPEKHHPYVVAGPLKAYDQVGEGESPEVAPRHDVVFVGSGFYERQQMLEGVDWEGLGVDFGLYGLWPYIGSRSRLRKYLRAGTVPNRVTAALYRNAGIGLNLYRQSVGTSKNATRIQGAESLNPRALELAATGTPHLSDWRPEVEEVFGPLVPTFKTPAELTDLIREYVRIGGHRQWRADRGQALAGAVKGWTFDARAEQLGAILATIVG